MESLSVGVFKGWLDMVLRDVILWLILVAGKWLDQMVLEVFTNLNNFMILCYASSSAFSTLHCLYYFFCSEHVQGVSHQVFFHSFVRDLGELCVWHF